MFTGCGTAMVTPFLQDGSLDEETLRRLVKRQIEAGIHFLIPVGTTGESPTLSKKEHLRVVEITLEEAKGKVPVLAGCGGYNTAELVELAKELEAMEADGLLSVTPYYNKPTPEGLYQHYRAVAGATQLPIVLYNVPGRTALNIKTETLVRLASIDGIVGVKEASGDIGQMAEVLQSVPPTFGVLSGDDAVTLPLMALGGSGVISVASNEAPAEMAKLCDLCLQGDFVAARAVHRRLYPLMTANFCETSPGPVKAAMEMMGLLKANYRLPMVPITPESRAKLEAVLRDLGMAASVAAHAD